MVSIAQPLPACLEADRSPLDAREPTKAPVHELFVSLADAVIGAAYALPSPPESASDDDSTPDSPDEKALRTEALLVRSCHQGWERSFELHHDWPRPALQAPDEILIRNVAVGLNPVDWKSVAYNFGIQNCPWVLGRDIAGVVEEVGTAVTDFQPSQRVWTCADSRDPRAGAYQRYSIAKACKVGRIPDNIDDEGAATIGTGLVTAAVILYWFFGFGLPKSTEAAPVAPVDVSSQTISIDDASKWVLIYGGSSITGCYLIQLCRLSNLRVAVIASPQNAPYLRSLGAELILDRYSTSGELRIQLHAATSGRLAYAVDCVGSKTAAFCEAALQDADGEWEGEAQLVCLAGNPKPQAAKVGQRSVRALKTHKISFSTTFYGDPTFSTTLLSSLFTLFSNASLRVARAEIVPDGLAGVRRGLESLRDGSAPGGRKCVIRLADTPSAELTNLGVRSELGWNGVP